MFSTVSEEFADIDVETLNVEVDWHSFDTMTDIDYQGQCAVEAIKILETGILEKLSVQELSDHVKSCDREGAFMYMKQREKMLKYAVYHQPVDVVIVVRDEFENYKAGDRIFKTHTDFSSERALHSVLVIDFGKLH
ncbi:hypothetical protein TSUD_116320 [Trifolium subterraneum]|uniref:Peptidase C1A papain C-terminal domain-containing protein n=1 Tax=Trifolium subterraneum TaxID=3900 RepID=A0A2Z6N6R8_TRISU|nr:hypothetical protein TSUD_116320 [Trifolium subterraneum]